VALRVRVVPSPFRLCSATCARHGLARLQGNRTGPRCRVAHRPCSRESGRVERTNWAASQACLLAKAPPAPSAGAVAHPTRNLGCGHPGEAIEAPPGCLLGFLLDGPRTLRWVAGAAVVGNGFGESRWGQAGVSGRRCRGSGMAEGPRTEKAGSDPCLPPPAPPPVHPPERKVRHPPENC